MKIRAVLFLLCVSLFSCWAVAADLFSPNLTLKEKIKLTRQIREQMTRQIYSDTRYSKNQHKKNTVNRSGSHLHISQKDSHNIRMILSLPLKNRKQALSNYGLSSFAILTKLVLSNKEAMPVRWKALTSLARLYPEKSRPLVLMALRSSKWFLRNAGLIAMEIMDPKEGLRWAGDFLDDPSLIIRTAAVDMIKKHKANQYKIHLLAKLNAPDSFHKNTSLWIRHHIVSALADFYEPGEEKMFISFLRDPDKRLHNSAILALEKLTGKTFRSTDKKQKLLAKTQKSMWINWWSEAGYNKKSAQL